MLRRGQFSLRSLLVAMALVASACAAARYYATTWYALKGDDHRGIAFFSIPIALCGAIGVLRGRLLTWLVIGALIDVAFLLWGIWFDHYGTRY